MHPLLFLPLYLGIGYLLRILGLVTPKALRGLNQTIIYGPLPAVTFVNIHALHLTSRAIYPMASAWILFFSGWAMMAWLGKDRNWSRQTRGAAILMAGMANTSFVGFPVLRALYGEEAIRYGVLVDQPGSFVVVSTFGLFIAASYSANGTGESSDPVSMGGRILRNVVTFPSFIALGLGILLRHWDMPISIESLFRAIGALLTPLALISVGLQLDPGAILSLRRSPQESSALFWCLLHKLILGPAVIALLFYFVFGLRGMECTVSVLETAMPPMITAGIVAAEYGLSPRLVSVAISLGIFLSGLTLAMWVWVLAL